MAIVTMSSTVGPLISGSVYRVRARYAETLVKATQATITARKDTTANPHLREGK